MANEAPSLTVAIPFHSGTDLLRRALASVAGQENARCELVVSDDSPAGNAAAIVAEFPDLGIRYYANVANRGMAGNWNCCLELARTDLVCLLHGDDELLPGYCAQMIQAGRQFSEATAFFCPTRIIDGQGRKCFSFADAYKTLLVPWGRRPFRLSGPSALAALLRGNFVFCPTLCFRRSKLGAVRFDGRWRFVLDLDLVARLLLAGHDLIGLRDIQYAYRRHEDNATLTFTQDLSRFDEELTLYQELAGQARARGWHAAARRAETARIIKLQLGYTGLRALAAGDLAAAGRAIRLLACIW